MVASRKPMAATGKYWLGWREWFSTIVRRREGVRPWTRGGANVFTVLKPDDMAASFGALFGSNRCCAHGVYTGRAPRFIEMR